MKKIFISENIIEHIAFNDNPDFDIIISTNPIEKITEFLSLTQIKPFTVVILIHIKDFENLFSVLKKIKYEDLIYSVLLINPQDREYELSEEKKKVILDMRNSKITAVEFKFIIEKAFSELEFKYKSSSGR